MREQRRLRPRNHRPRAAIEEIEQKPRRVSAAFEHIDVRISLEADHDIRVVDHLLRDVRVQIESDRYGCMRQCGTQPLEQVTLAVVGIFCNHCAVQIEHDGVTTVRGIHNCVADDVVRNGRDRTARIRRRRNRRDKLRARSFGCVDKRGHGGLHALVLVVRVLAERGTVTTERRQGCSHRRERIGLVIHACDKNFHAASTR